MQRIFRNISCSADRSENDLLFTQKGKRGGGDKKVRSDVGSVIAKARDGGGGGFLPVIMRQKSLNLALEELPLSRALTKLRGTRLSRTLRFFLNLYVSDQHDGLYIGRSDFSPLPTSQ